MYAKLFARITESSLMEEPINVRYTFVLMLAIADPEGYVIGTDVAIARRLNMPIEEFQSCIAILMSPDASSNSKEEEGRRVLPSDSERGYHLVNYRSYRDMKDPIEKRKYMRDYMRKYRSSKSQDDDQQEVAASVKHVKQCKPQLSKVTHVDVEAPDIKARRQNDDTSRNELRDFPDFSEVDLSDPQTIRTAIIVLERHGRFEPFKVALAAATAVRKGKKPNALFVKLLREGWGKFVPADKDHETARQTLKAIGGYSNDETESDDEQD